MDEGWINVFVLGGFCCQGMTPGLGLILIMLMMRRSGAGCAEQ